VKFRELPGTVKQYFTNKLELQAGSRKITYLALFEQIKTLKNIISVNISTPFKKLFKRGSSVMEKE
jgi:hypothetical protein